MMNPRLLPWPALATLFVLNPSALAAQSRQDAIPPAVSAHFANLAQQRPRPCGAGASTTAPPPGWRTAGAQCAWGGLLQVRYWQAAPGVPALTCISPQATWWSWARQRLMPDTSPVWQRAWTSSALRGEKNGLRHFFTMTKSDAGVWTGVEWSWSPSHRSATRQWQLGRWQLITASTQAAPSTAWGADSPGAFVAAAWERNLRGRPAEIAAKELLWESKGTCMNLRTVAPTEIPFQLAFDRADVRLEQLAAMQVQLARRLPEVRWLVPFKLLDTGAAGMPGAAKYEAIWSNQATVNGQLWMPSKNKGPILAIRISATPLGNTGSPLGRASSAAIGDSLQGELLGMATQLGEQHDR